jgi:hypothetical protein
MRVFRFVPVVVSLALLSSCATIAHGRYQSVPVASSPSGADVTLECNGRAPKSVGTTPVIVHIKRRAPECRITLVKDGFQPASVSFAKSVSPWIWGNLIWGDWIIPTALVDYFDGATYNRYPTSVQFSLVPDSADWRSRPTR